MDLKKKLSMLKETGKVDGRMSGKEVGKVLDMYNKDLENSRDKDFEKEIHDRNLHFVPLVKYAMKHGPDKAYESNKTLIFTDN